MDDIKKRGLIITSDQFYELYGPKEIEDISRLINLQSEPVSKEQVLNDLSILKECEVLMVEWGCMGFDSDMLAYLPGLKAVFYAGGSIRGLVSDLFWDKGIIISSAYGANAVSVAQYTVSEILSCLKRVRFHAQETKQASDFVPRGTHFVPGTYQTTLGIVSLGMIGRLVCKYIQAITEMKIIAYDPYVSEKQASEMDVEMCSLEDVFKLSDVVSLHTPDLDETKGMITGRHFNSMKQHASFINTARGAIVKENEMIDVLKERPDLEAVLDVTNPEPPVKNSELYDLENVFLTPHISGCMGPECVRMGRYMVEELERYVTGKKLKWQIAKKQAEIMA